MKTNNYDRFLNLFDTIPAELSVEALTHSSYANEHNILSNERLEYLGDSVLGLIVTEYLFAHSKEQEGKLSKMRSALVCEESLAKLAHTLSIADKLKVGKSFNNIALSNAILADTVEAMIGAVFMHHGFASIKSAVIKLLDIQQFLASGGKSQDYKTVLQEYCQKNKMRPLYKSESYETKGGQPNFRCNVNIDKKVAGTGQGSTKREAEQNAAHHAVVKLKIII